MRGRRARSAAGIAAVVLSGLVLPGPRGQDSEVIVLDPNHPLIQNPGTVRPSPGEAAPRAAGTPTPDVPPVQEGVNAREVLSDLWFKEQAVAQHGDSVEAARLVETALDFMKREGLSGAPQIASAFQSEGSRLLQDGDYRGAQDNFVLASRFDPSLVGAHVGLAVVLLRGERDLKGTVREGWTALKVWLRDAGSVYQEAGNGLLVLYLGLCFGVAAALLLTCLHAAPAFFHDLKERFPRRVSDDTSRLLGWSLMSLPIVLLTPFVWLVASWNALFFPYFRRSERLLALLGLLLLIAAGPAGLVVDWIAGTAVDPGARALIRSLRGGYDVQDLKALEALTADHRDDPLFPFVLATMHRTAGRFDEAMTLYRHILEIDPSHARAMVNLANLHALRQEFAIAQNLYKKAGEVDPRLAIAHYDSHLAHLEAFHLESADQELKEARLIDDALVTSLLAQGNEGRVKRMPADVGYTRSEIWKRALSLRLDRGLRTAAGQALAAPATLAGGAGLLLALLVPGIGIAPRSAAARRCLRCGRPFCRRCRVRTKDADHCSQCVHLFILRDGVAPTVKSRKMDEVVRYRRRVWVGRRLLSLPLPGSGHVLGGRPWLGALLLACWCGAWLGIVLRGQLLVPGDSLGAADLGVVSAFGGFGLLVWLFGNLSSQEAERE